MTNQELQNKVYKLEAELRELNNLIRGFKDESKDPWTIRLSFTYMGNSHATHISLKSPGFSKKEIVKDRLEEFTELILRSI